MPTYRLSSLATVYRLTGEINDFARGGDPRSEPIEVVKAWVNLRPLSGNERVVANQIFPSATYRAILRWPGVPISPEMWIEVNARRFEILGVTELEDQYLELALTSTDVAVGEVPLR